MSRLQRAVVILALAAGGGACGTDRAASVPPLPDLGAMAAPVQQQIRDEYARLTTGPAASASDRDRAAALGRVGELLMAAESVPAAEPFLSQAAALDPSEPRWPYFLGHLSRMKGDAPGAASHFQRVLTLRPDDVPSLVWLGNLSLDQGQTEAAERSYTRALELHPNLFAALFGLGRTALVAGRNQDAVTKLEAAVAAEPRATAANYPLAMAYRQAGRLDEAEARLRARGDAQPPVPDPLMAELADILESPSCTKGAVTARWHGVRCRRPWRRSGTRSRWRRTGRPSSRSSRPRSRSRATCLVPWRCTRSCSEPIPISPRRTTASARCW